jgi:hypothetical protein
VPFIAPRVNGKNVDLYTVYQCVVQMGGWRRVSAGNRWPEVYASCKLDEDMCCADYGLKILYMQ